MSAFKQLFGSSSSTSPAAACSSGPLAAAGAPSPPRPLLAPRNNCRPHHNCCSPPGGSRLLVAAAAAASGKGGATSKGGSAAAKEQLPPPTVVLDCPPELEDAHAAAAAAALADAPPHWSPLQQQGGASSPQQPVVAAAVAAATAPPLLKQQQSQQQVRRAGHTMSGRRLAARLDVPLGLDWLADLPAHEPRLGGGRLEVIVGPMFAGKTTALLARVAEVAAAAEAAAAAASAAAAGSGGASGSSTTRPPAHVAVKSSKDARYSGHWVISHDGACMRCYAADSLAQFRVSLGPAWSKLALLAIDEAQFFPDLREFCEAAVDGDGKHVIVAGLAGDFKRQRFGQVLDLLPLADSVTQLRSTCGFCGADALFSLRLASGGPQEVVGGDEAYRPTCRRCYLQHSAGQH